MKMKKLMRLFAFVPLLVVSLAGSAGASIMPPPPEGVPTSDLSVMITQISTVILTLVGVIAILFLIIGGFQYITASGNPDQVQRAKLTIMYSVIGIAVAILSYVIVRFVIQAL